MTAALAPVMFDAHGMQPDVVLGMLAMLGGRAGRILIVGCEPGSAEPGMGLSAPVAAAVDEAVPVVLGLVGNNSGPRKRTQAEDSGEGGRGVSWHTR